MFHNRNLEKLVSLHAGDSYLFWISWTPPQPHFSTSEVLVNDCRSALPQMFTSMIWCTEMSFLFLSPRISFWVSLMFTQLTDFCDHGEHYTLWNGSPWMEYIFHMCALESAESLNCILKSSVNVNCFCVVFHKTLHITAHCFMLLLTSVHAIMQCAWMRVWWLCEGGACEMVRNTENSWSNLNHLHNTTNKGMML